jgi:diadenosine tetraphosphate (Ap4A) HIT family hydrolase
MDDEITNTAGGEDCFSCEQTAKGSALPIRERIYDDGTWRVAHSFNSALPGWLVIVPHRHITTVAALTPDEAATLGWLQQRLSLALENVVGCVKTYVMMFAESEGFGHIHFHIVPRMSDLTREHKGPRVFWYLDRPQTEWVPVSEMDRLGAAIAAQLTL